MGNLANTKISNHPAINEINKALLGGVSQRQIVKNFGSGKTFPGHAFGPQTLKDYYETEFMETAHLALRDKQQTIEQHLSQNFSDVCEEVAAVRKAAFQEKNYGLHKEYVELTLKMMGVYADISGTKQREPMHGTISVQHSFAAPSAPWKQIAANAVSSEEAALDLPADLR